MGIGTRQFLQATVATAFAFAIGYAAFPTSYAVESIQPTATTAAQQAVDQYTDKASASAAIRQQMLARNNTITVRVKTGKDEGDTLARELIYDAFQITESTTDGDYLFRHYGGYKSTTTSICNDGVYYYDISYTVSYYTTAKQEAELTSKIKTVMSELNLSKKTDLEKIRAIYRYITQNVTYDYAHENDSSYYLQNTAYGALVNGTACCQGIANLQYRMLKEAGLECHIVAGTASGLRHAWVVVNVDGSNYYLDATWDLGKSEQGYGHFLTGTTEDPEHIMDDEYKEKYSISKTAYVKFVASPTLSKVENVNGGVKVTWKAVSGAVRYRVYHKTASGKWELLGNTTGTSFTDKKVSGGTTYTYTVRCVTADNRSFTSGYNSKGLSIKYIASPELSSVSNAAKGVTVKWSASKGAEKYRVYRKTGSSGWTKLYDTTSTSYTDTSAQSGTTYYYTVRCITANGKSTTSNYNSKGLSIKHIAAPKLSSVSNVAKGVTVKWSASKGAEKYRVYRKTGSSGWTKLADTTSTSYTDKTAKAGTTYTYTVRCLTKNGKSFTSGYDTTGKTIKRLTQPTPSVSKTSNGIKTSWSKVTGASKYYVYRKTASGSWSKIGSTSSTSYTDKTAKKGTTYYYTVRAVSGSYLSSYTSSKAIKR